jgi:pyruvate/2-oxoglutarate dehydrogenase complex dihydrolipoamide acyltransferase (E2) component
LSSCLNNREDPLVERVAENQGRSASPVLRVFPPLPFSCHTMMAYCCKAKGEVPMDSTPSGPEANTDQSSADVKAPMNRPRANTDQGSAEMKALEEALSSVVGKGLSDWRTKMASSDALGAVEPSPYTTPRPADLKGKIGLLSGTPPPGRRGSRGLTLLSIVGFISVGCILAWQFYDESAKETLASWASQLGWVQPLSGRKPPGAGLKTAERPDPRALQEPTPDLPQAASAAQTAPDIGAPPTPAAWSPEVQRALEVMALDLADLRQTVNRLEVMARDLADLRQTVNRLAVGQEQMARREGLTSQDLSAKTSRCACAKPSA